MRGGRAGAELRCAASGFEYHEDRHRGAPLFATKPDERLVPYVDGGLLGPGRALDLGRGHRAPHSPVFGEDYLQVGLFRHR